MMLQISTLISLILIIMLPLILTDNLTLTLFIPSYQNLTQNGIRRVQIHPNGKIFYEVLNDYNCPQFYQLSPDSECQKEIWREMTVQTENLNTTFLNCILNEEDAQNIPIASRVLGMLMILSALFLLLTFTAYALLWRQHTTHGHVVMAHTASMFFMYLFLWTRDIIRHHFPDFVLTPWCFVNGILTHFFVLSTFTWLTLTCFHLFRTFRSVVPYKNYRGCGCQILISTLIGWGLPALFVFLSAFLDILIGDKCTRVLLPKYSHNCYVHVNAFGPYVLYPVTGSLLINLSLFCCTIINLYHYNKSSQNVLHNRRQQFKVYTKLFIVTGMIWILELLIWLYVQDFGRRLYWALIDAINLFQSLAIFIIYVCKIDILQSLAQLYPNSVLTKHLLRHILHFVNCSNQRPTCAFTCTQPELSPVELE